MIVDKEHSVFTEMLSTLPSALFLSVRQEQQERGMKPAILCSVNYYFTQAGCPLDITNQPHHSNLDLHPSLHCATHCTQEQQHFQYAILLAPNFPANSKRHRRVDIDPSSDWCQATLPIRKKFGVGFRLLFTTLNLIHAPTSSKIS